MRGPRGCGGRPPRHIDSGLFAEQIGVLEARQIGGDDALSALRHDTKLLEAGQRSPRHIIMAEETHLIDGQRRLGQQLQEGCLQFAESERHRHQRAPAPRRLQRQ